MDFLNWEALQAHIEGIDLTNFKLADYDVPYSYSPVIAANRIKVNKNQGAVKAFLEATKKGFYFAKNNPIESDEILSQHIPIHDQNIDLVKAIQLSCEALGDKNSWGKIDFENVYRFLSWLREKELEHSQITVKDLFISF